MLRKILFYLTKASTVEAVYNYDKDDNLINYKIVTTHNIFGFEIQQVYQDGKLVEKAKEVLKNTNSFRVETIWSLEK